MPTKAEKLEKQKLKLDSRQIAFVHYLMFVTKGDGIKAADMAGYKGDSSKLSQIATRLLQHPGVIAERERVSALPVPHRPTIANRAEILEKLTMMARLDHTKAVNHRGILGAIDKLGEMLGYTKHKEAEELYKRNLTVIYAHLQTQVDPAVFAQVMQALATLPAEVAGEVVVETSGESVQPTLPEKAVQNG